MTMECDRLISFSFGGAAESMSVEGEMSRLADHLFGVSVKKDENSEENASSAAATNQSASEGTGTADATIDEAEQQANYEKREVAAEWRVPLRGKLHKIEFEHGTATGRRILWIDAKEVLRRDWMFKLVGDDIFSLEGLRCVLRVDPAPGFKYKYSLIVDGKPFEQFKDSQAKAHRMWEATVNEKKYRILLEKETLNIFMNGILREEDGDFTDNGTQTSWQEDGIRFQLTAKPSENKREGLVHALTINGKFINEVCVNDI